MRPQDPFETLLHRYRGLLFTLCQRHANRSVEVDDLLQEAAIALWRARERVLPLPSVQQAALVWKIARNAVIDNLRRTPLTDSLPDDYDTVEDDKTFINELHEQIALLDEPDRTIVRMQLEGYNYEEIGEAVNMTEKNVSVRLVRIKDKLRKKMTI
jgi:RNA polymerase sigma-70 factor (ECF subfamily)